MERYIRQLSLPEMDLLKQEKLGQTSVLMIGAGGLGAAALPYLAGAGIGKITIMDRDYVDISNLHRQILYKTADVGKGKAQLTADHLRALNPEIEVIAINEKLTKENMDQFCNGHDLLIDGTDNFKSKSLLNEASIKFQTPLLSASVNRFEAQIGIYNGAQNNAPCYHCVFPQLPEQAMNCSEAGLFGTSAGLAGLYQANIALLYLTGIGGMESGDFIQLNFKTLRIEKLKAPKNQNCPYCKQSDTTTAVTHSQQTQNNKTISTGSKTTMTEAKIIDISDLGSDNLLIIDVRQPEELQIDPVTDLVDQEYLNIPLPELPARIEELPKGRKLALLCAANVRSKQGAEYLIARGFEDVCVLNKFSLERK